MKHRLIWSAEDVFLVFVSPRFFRSFSLSFFLPISLVGRLLAVHSHDRSKSGD